jgi:hypothetical protein
MQVALITPINNGETTNNVKINMSICFIVKPSKELKKNNKLNLIMSYEKKKSVFLTY